MAAPAPKNRPPRLDLPFRPRKIDAGEWAYDHRAGLCVTVIFFLLMGIAMVSTRIIVGARPATQGMFIELVDPTLRSDEQRREEMREMESDEDLRNAQNRISNENAEDRARGARTRSALQRQIEAEAAAVQGRMASNRSSYEQGLRDVAAIGERRPTDQEDSPDMDAKVAGTVLVRFSLANPLRTSVNLHVPGYQCRGGGEVEIEIVVDRSGRVTSASPSRASRSVDACMVDAALAAARVSRFNLDASAPEKQRGTITYIFVPQ